MPTRHGTLQAATIAEEAFTSDVGTVQIIHYGDDPEPIFATVNGAAPAVDADDVFVVLAGGFRVIDRSNVDGPTSVKLISAGTPRYEVMV